MDSGAVAIPGEVDGRRADRARGGHRRPGSSATGWCWSSDPAAASSPRGPIPACSGSAASLAPDGLVLVNGSPGMTRDRGGGPGRGGPEGPPGPLRRPGAVRRPAAPDRHRRGLRAARRGPPPPAPQHRHRRGGRVGGAGLAGTPAPDRGRGRVRRQAPVAVRDDHLRSGHPGAGPLGAPADRLRVRRADGARLRGGLAGAGSRSATRWSCWRRGTPSRRRAPSRRSTRGRWARR